MVDKVTKFYQDGLTSELIKMSDQHISLLKLLKKIVEEIKKHNAEYMWVTF